MSRPDFITNEDISRWDTILALDPVLTKFTPNDLILEACYAGCYLGEQLELLDCPEELILRITFTQGKMSFGRDPWDVSLMLLDKYKNNELLLEDDADTVSN